MARAVCVAQSGDRAVPVPGPLLRAVRLQHVHRDQRAQLRRPLQRQPAGDPGEEPGPEPVAHPGRVDLAGLRHDTDLELAGLVRRKLGASGKDALDHAA